MSAPRKVTPRVLQRALHLAGGPQGSDPCFATPRQRSEAWFAPAEVVVAESAPPDPSGVPCSGCELGRADSWDCACDRRPLPAPSKLGSVDPGARLAPLPRQEPRCFFL